MPSTSKIRATSTILTINLVLLYETPNKEPISTPLFSFYLEPQLFTHSQLFVLYFVPFGVKGQKSMLKCP